MNKPTVCIPQAILVSGERVLSFDGEADARYTRNVNNEFTWDLPSLDVVARHYAAANGFSLGSSRGGITNTALHCVYKSKKLAKDGDRVSTKGGIDIFIARDTLRFELNGHES